MSSNTVFLITILSEFSYIVIVSLMPVLSSIDSDSLNAGLAITKQY